MKLKFSKILSLSIILILLWSYNNVLSQSNIKIVKKINNQIITNVDILNEYNYLIALNNNLKNINLDEAYKIAENSLIREKIKYEELQKNFDLKNFNQNYLIEQIIFNIIGNLKLKDELDFETYLKNYNLTLSEVKEKIKIEILWNQLIKIKYSNKININEELIKRKVEFEILQNEVIEYDLSEIVFQIQDKLELDKKIKEIENSIKLIGFDNTATKYSLSDTAKFGGKIGKIRENELSKFILDELKQIETKQYTKPIKTGSGFMILYINNKNMIKIDTNTNEIIKKITDNERQKQFENFSQIYFNKIKINTIINEY